MSILKKTWTHWQWYKSFFSITILRYLVLWFSLVPMLALWLNQIPEGKIYLKDIKILKDNKISSEGNLEDIVTYFEIDLGLPFSWELLWASSLFFVVALIIYVIFCPSFIKKYPSFKDYKAHYHSPRWIVWEAKKVAVDKSEIPLLFDRLNTKKYLKIENQSKPENINKVIVEALQTKLYFKYSNQDYSLGMPILFNKKEIDRENTDNVEREIFWEIFGRYSSSKPFWRGVIILLLFLSLICFSIPVVQNIIKGGNYLIESIILTLN